MLQGFDFAAKHRPLLEFFKEYVAQHTSTIFNCTVHLPLACTLTQIINFNYDKEETEKLAHYFKALLKVDTTCNAKKVCTVKKIICYIFDTSKEMLKKHILKDNNKDLAEQIIMMMHLTFFEKSFFNIQEHDSQQKDSFMETSAFLYEKAEKSLSNPDENPFPNTAFNEFKKRSTLSPLLDLNGGAHNPISGFVTLFGYTTETCFRTRQANYTKFLAQHMMLQGLSLYLCYSADDLSSNSVKILEYLNQSPLLDDESKIGFLLDLKFLEGAQCAFDALEKIRNIKAHSFSPFDDKLDAVIYTKRLLNIIAQTENFIYTNFIQPEDFQKQIATSSFPNNSVGCFSCRILWRHAHLNHTVIQPSFAQHHPCVETKPTHPEYMATLLLTIPTTEPKQDETLSSNSAKSLLTPDNTYCGILEKDNKDFSIPEKVFKQDEQKETFSEDSDESFDEFTFLAKKLKLRNRDEAKKVNEIFKDQQLLLQLNNSDPDFAPDELLNTTKLSRTQTQSLSKPVSVELPIHYDKQHNFTKKFLSYLQIKPAHLLSNIHLPFECAPMSRKDIYRISKNIWHLILFPYSETRQQYIESLFPLFADFLHKKTPGAHLWRASQIITLCAPALQNERLTQLSSANSSALEILNDSLTSPLLHDTNNPYHTKAIPFSISGTPTLSGFESLLKGRPFELPSVHAPFDETFFSQHFGIFQAYDLFNLLKLSAQVTSTEHPLIRDLERFIALVYCTNASTTLQENTYYQQLKQSCLKLQSTLPYDTIAMFVIDASWILSEIGEKNELSQNILLLQKNLALATETSLNPVKLKIINNILRSLHREITQYFALNNIKPYRCPFGLSLNRANFNTLPSSEESRARASKKRTISTR